MSIQYSDTVRNAELDAIETAISTAPTLTIRSGAAPADSGATNCPLVSIEIKRPSTESVNSLNLLVSLVIL